MDQEMSDQELNEYMDSVEKEETNNSNEIVEAVSTSSFLQIPLLDCVLTLDPFVLF